MSLERFYLDTVFGAQGTSHLIDGQEAQHMLRVMRKKADDEVTLFNGRGDEVRARISACDKRSAEMEICGEVEREAPRPGRLELAIALPRGGEIVEVVRRAIEAGADVIRPLVATRSVHRSDKKSDEKRSEKMNQAAITALKQCGRNLLPTFTAPTRLQELALESEQVGVYGSTRGGLSLRQFEKKHGGVPRNLMIVVGPEGGFTDQEYAYLDDSGFEALSLGTLVYRVETAAIALLSFFSSAGHDEVV